MNTEHIKKELEKQLDSKRYQHTLGVAYTAASLAMRYEMDINQAFLAGLLHDCAKSMTHEERLSYCKKHDITVTEAEQKNPSLLHAKVGSDQVFRKYGIKDAEIANAVRYHTTGHPDMTMLEKIIFIADYIEPLRDHDKELSEIRHMSFMNIDVALEHILKNTLEYLNSSKKEIDPMTALTYSFYMENTSY